MSREGALGIVLVVVIGLIGLMAWAWWRRMKRDAGPLIHAGELPPSATVLATFETLYVATTKHDMPLERIVAPGMAFRDRATLTVADAGIAIDMTGQQRTVLPSDRIIDVEQSTVAIDRVVEPGGLTRITWRTDVNTIVDSYYRPQDASARALADAIRGILAPSSSGPDA